MRIDTEAKKSPLNGFVPLRRGKTTGSMHPLDKKAGGGAWAEPRPNRGSETHGQPQVYALGICGAAWGTSENRTLARPGRFRLGHRPNNTFERPAQLAMGKDHSWQAIRASWLDIQGAAEGVHCLRLNEPAATGTV